MITLADLLEALTPAQPRLANATAESVSAVSVERLAPLAGAGPRDVGFFFSKEYADELKTGCPGVLITAEPFLKPLEQSGHPVWSRGVVIACRDPYLGLALLSERFADVMTSNAHRPGERAGLETEVHPSATVSPEAHLGRSVVVGPGCVIEAGARLGDRVRLYGSCTVGRDSEIGADSVLFPGVTVYERCVLGARARVHAGAVIGSDGFGFAQVKVPGSPFPVRHQKIYHLGRVVCGDDVEIGANTCLDRGTFGETRLGNQVKLDNQVHIGHNCVIGEGTVICGGTALAGGVKIGRWVMVGGLTGITNRVEVGDGAQVGALALVTKDVPAGGTAVGNPQREYKDHFRVHARMNRLISRGRNEEQES